MKKETIILSGYIRSKVSKAGLSNLKVEAWDKDNRFDDLGGSGTSDKKGRFSITLQQKSGGWNLTDSKPDIYFKVYSGDRLLHNTVDSVL